MWGQTIYMLAGKLYLKLKRMSAKQAECPLAVENLRDAETEEKFKLKLRNQFEALEHSQDVEVEWDRMRNCVNETAEEVIGKRRGTRKEQWITQDTWKLIDERKEAKCKHDQSVQGNKELNQQYASLNNKVKKSCKKDKKAFIEKKQKQTRLLRKIILRRYSKLSKN